MTAGTPQSAPVEPKTVTDALREAYTLLISAEPAIQRDAESSPNETSAHYKALLVGKVREWLDPFRDDFDGGVESLSAASYDDGYRTALDHAVMVIEQARNTVRAEAGDLPSGKAGIAAREHSIALIESLRGRVR